MNLEAHPCPRSGHAMLNLRTYQVEVTVQIVNVFPESVIVEKRAVAYGNPHVYSHIISLRRHCYTYNNLFVLASLSVCTERPNSFKIPGSCNLPNAGAPLLHTANVLSKEGSLAMHS